MAVRERVALLFLIVVVLFTIKYSHCLPKNLAHRPKLEKKLKQILNVNSTPPPANKPMVKTNSRNRISKIKNNPIQENLCEKFNFPEIQYPIASTPNTPVYFHEFVNNSPSKPTQTYNTGGSSTHNYSKTDNKRRNKQIKSKSPLNAPEYIKGAEFSSAPSYRDIGILPDVEYPLNTKDLWQPSYWNCPSKVFTPYPMNNSSKILTRRRMQGSFNPKFKPKPSAIQDIYKINKTNNLKPSISQNQRPQNVYHPRIITSRNQSECLKKDLVQSDLPKKRSHDVRKLIPEDPDYFDNFYAATPTPYSSQKDDKIKTALRSKICSNIAQKAVSLIKNIVHSEKTTTTENYNEILEDILCLSPPEFNDYSLINSDKFHTTTPRTSLDYSYPTDGRYNVTQPWINLFTAFTEKPQQYNHSQNSKSVHKTNATNIIENDSHAKIENTSLFHDTINSKTDVKTLAPRGHIYEDNTLIHDKKSSIVGESHHSDINVSDKIIISYNNTQSKIIETDKRDKTPAYNINDLSLKLDDDYTTDVYPESSENGFVLSTVSPQYMSLDDPSWTNAEIVDPYKSLSYPDELEEYYIAVS